MSETIYMPLLDEGVEVWRPAYAIPIRKNEYRILGPMPDDETWAFPPGATVIVRFRRFDDGDERLTAVALAQ